MVIKMTFYLFDDDMRLSQANSLPFEERSMLLKQYWAEAETTDDAIYTRAGGLFCPVCGGMHMNRWEKPRKIVLTGTHYPDRISLWLVYRLIISERFKQMYEKERLTGIAEFEDLEYVKYTKQKNGTKPPNYYNAVIPFSESVFFDTQKTVIRGKPHAQKMQPTCQHCEPFDMIVDHFDKLALNTTNWDGMDIFRVYGYGKPFLSQRMKDKIVEYGLTNCELVNVDEFSS